MRPLIVALCASLALIAGCKPTCGDACERMAECSRKYDADFDVNACEDGCEAKNESLCASAAGAPTDAEVLACFEGLSCDDAASFADGWRRCLDRCPR